MNSFFVCRTQYENLGDLIINKMLIDELALYGTVYIDTTTVPDSFKHTLLDQSEVVEVRFLEDRKWFRSSIVLLKFFRQNGIRLYTSSPGPVFGSVVESFKYQLVSFLTNRFFSLFGIKRHYIGTCCSHLVCGKRDFHSNEIAYYYLRSNISVDYLRRYVPKKRIKYIPDLCFLLHYQVKSSAKKNVVIIDIRKPDSGEETLIQWCVNITRAFTEQGFEVIVYYQVERDYCFAQRIYGAIVSQKVSFQSNIVWYDNMDFYADKKFVISNRLHSLLIGAAYDCFPICLYQNSVHTAKLKDVFSSAFSDDMPILYENGAVPIGNLADLFDKYGGLLKEEYSENAGLCRQIISDIVGNT